MKTQSCTSTSHRLLQVLFVLGIAAAFGLALRVGGASPPTVLLLDNLRIARLPADRAPEIANPSFEADTFTNFPGYVSGNGPITGWTAFGGHGVNPGTFGGPFSDNGKIPDGTKAAFLQEDGALSQIVSGFSIGATYQIRYFENARTGNPPSCEVKAGGNTVVAAHPVSPVGGVNPYREVLSDPFVATATALEIAFIKSNPAGGDTTLLIDNVSFVAPNTPPTITSQPQDVGAIQGETAVFNVNALGSAPLSFHWYFGTDILAGQTERSLSILVDFPDVVGNYSVVVSNLYGAVTSRLARLSIVLPVPGAFNTGVDDTGVALMDGLSETHYKLVLNPDNTGETPLVEDSTRFPIVTGPWVANNAGSKWIGPRFETSASAGGGGSAGDYTYRTVIDLSGFDPATVRVTGGWATDNAGLDILVNGQSTGQANSAQFGSLTPFALNNLLDGPNTVDFKLNNSAVGYTGLRVDQLRVVGAPLPPNTKPFIAQQPHDVTATVNERVTFGVRANGSAPLTYQWFFGADPIVGETSPTLSFILDFPDRGGQYSVAVHNDFGDVHSAAATLTVREAPAILTQPLSQVVAVGDTVSFTVRANGFEPLSYQWKKDGADITSATDSTFTIASAALSDAATYSVRVFNTAGQITSVGASLTVLLNVPGLFNTGVGPDGVALADAAVDPHYQLIINPDGASTDAIVENSTVFPIAAGPWVANTDTSKWIGPRLETSASALGDYTYRLSFDLSGFDPGVTRLRCDWATDNEGMDVILNGTSTGQHNTGQFVVYTALTLTSGFVPGINQIDFKVNNSAVGYTGLRVRDLRVLSLHARPLIQSITFIGGGGVRLVWSAQVGEHYLLQFKNNLNNDAWSDVAGEVIATGTTASKDDPSSGPMRFYRVRQLQALR